VNFLPDETRKELILAYLSFPFFDVLTFPLLRWQPLDDVDTVLVARISPQDCTALETPGTRTALRGRELGHFGAFFSREAREHDYVWGRLHAAERLVDFVVDAASSGLQTVSINEEAIKSRLFRAILKNEAEHLTKSSELLRTLSDRTDALLAGEATDTQ